MEVKILTFSSLVRNSHMGIAEPQARARQQQTSTVAASAIAKLPRQLLPVMSLSSLSFSLIPSNEAKSKNLLVYRNNVAQRKCSLSFSRKEKKLGTLPNRDLSLSPLH